jgi:hypothetical protein
MHPKSDGLTGAAPSQLSKSIVKSWPLGIAMPDCASMTQPNHTETADCGAFGNVRFFQNVSEAYLSANKGPASPSDRGDPCYELFLVAKQPGYLGS